mmetsp:Transcript_51776/g.144582  ORF Transcript_51776/g.144582 Transcript_51776/m.144582 type:complete len:254 (-) Transcript_51776:33-794(-)
MAQGLNGHVVVRLAQPHVALVVPVPVVGQRRPGHGRSALLLRRSLRSRRHGTKLGIGGRGAAVHEGRDPFERLHHLAHILSLGVGLVRAHHHLLLHQHQVHQVFGLTLRDVARVHQRLDHVEQLLLRCVLAHALGGQILTREVLEQRRKVLGVRVLLSHDVRRHDHGIVPHHKVLQDFDFVRAEDVALLQLGEEVEQRLGELGLGALPGLVRRHRVIAGEHRHRVAWRELRRAHAHPAAHRLVARTAAGDRTA